MVERSILTPFPGSTDINDININAWEDITLTYSNGRMQHWLERIKSITKPLKLDWDGKVRRTSVKISDEAKIDFVKYYFITSNNITVI